MKAVMSGMNDPLEDLKAMRDRMADLLAETQRAVIDVREPVERTVWRPGSDTFEVDDGLVVVVEIPGVDRAAVTLEVEGGRMTVRGERPAPVGLDPGRVLRQERAYGQFARVFDLPADVDVARIAAEQRNGVLTIRLPRIERATGSRIQITVE